MAARVRTNPFKKLNATFSRSQGRIGNDHIWQRELFTACLACHTERPDALGPSLKGVIGRKTAALEDFRYSPAMRRADLTWDDKNLHDYLMDPQGKVKGNRMPFSGFPNAADADDVIAYLQTYK